MNDDWITKLRQELMLSKMTHSFTFSRDEVIELLSASKPAAIDGQEAAIRAVAADIEAMTATELRAEHELHRNGDIATALRELHAAPSADTQDERGAFCAWVESKGATWWKNVHPQQCAEIAWFARASLQSPAYPADAAAPAQSGEPVADPKHDLHARIKIAREAGLQLRIDAKFGSDRYHSVTGSWPAVCRFAWALYNTAPQPAQTAQSDVCECGYSIETSCNVLDPACRRYTGKPAPSAVALDDERAAFEVWWIGYQLGPDWQEAPMGDRMWIAWQARAASPRPVAQTERALTDEQIKDIAKEHFFNGMPILTCAVEFARTLLTAARPASGADHD